MLEEILLLNIIVRDYCEDELYKQFLDKNYDVKKMFDRYLALSKEYLKQYALNTPEKSD